MTSSVLTWPDIASFVLVAWPAVSGLVRGFAWQAVRLAGWIAALALARTLGPALAERLSRSFDLSEWSAQALAWFAVFLTVVALAASLAWFLRSLLVRVRLAAYDRLAGLLLGAAKGFLLAGIFLFLAGRFLPAEDMRRTVRASRSHAFAERALERLGRFLPEGFPATPGRAAPASDGPR